jgi:AbrB family looped-hinge helix DNA binding protein
MTVATLTSKGQVTLPKSVRDRLGVQTGDRVEFIETPAGFLILPVKRELAEIKGIVLRTRKHVTVEDMNRAMARIGTRR